jgi:hypothetical protein
LCLKGFGDVIHSPDLKGFDFIKYFVQRTEENNGNV